MKQTAVEWLENKVWELDNENFTVPNRLLEAIQQAKEMEKEQQDKFAIEFAEWAIDYSFNQCYSHDLKELLQGFKNKQDETD